MTVSVSVPEDLRKRMQNLDEINWSAVARKAFERTVEDIETIQKITEKSKLTKKDAKEIADRIDAEVSRKFVEQARKGKN